MIRIFFYGLVLLGCSFLASAQTLDGQSPVCPSNPGMQGYNYTVYNIPLNNPGCSNIQNIMFNWTVVGGFITSNNNSTTASGLGMSTLVNVVWTHDTNPKSISVILSGGCGSANKQIQLRVPGALPVGPTSISGSNVKMCAGDQITLTANMPSNPNVDANPNNDIVYFWEQSINGGPYSLITYNFPTNNTLNYTVPQPSATSSSIQFRVFTRYNNLTTCWMAPNPGYPGDNLNKSNYAFSPPETIRAVPPSPTLGICMDGTQGTLFLKSVSGTSLSPNYAVNVQNVGLIGGINTDEVIASIANYSSVPYDFYYDVGNPLDGCKVSGTTPTVNDHTLNVSSIANCTAGLSVTNVTGGHTPYTYRVNGGYQASTTFPNLTPGTNTVTAKDVHGCVGTSSIQTFALLAFQTSTITPDCPGVQTNGSITLLGSGGKTPYTYSIAGVNGGAYQSPGLFASLANSTYTVSVKDSNGSGCTATTTAIVSNSPPITINSITPQSPTCFGGNNGLITVNAGGGLNSLTYSRDGSTFQTNAVLGTLVGGNYTITVQDENQCRVTSGNVALVNPPALSFSSITPTLQSCSGVVDGAISVVGTGGTGARQYSIDNINFVNEGAPTVFSGLVSKSYTVYVKDANNCTLNSSLLVGLKPLISGSFLESPSISCVGRTDGALNLTPSGGTAPYTFNWTHGPLTEDVSGLKAGTYTVTIKDSKTCQQTVNYLLKDPFPINIASSLSVFNGFNVSCFGSTNGWIDLTLSGGTGALSSQWSTGSTQTDLNGLSAGHYEVEVKDSKLCTATKAFDLTTPAVVNVSLAAEKNISCFGANDGSITLLPTGGTSSYEYSLNGTTWQPSTIFAGLSPATYTARLRDSNGCQATLGHTITTPSVVQLSSVDKNTVCGQSNGSSVVSVTGGVPDYVYKWYTNGNTLIGSSASINNLSSGIYRVDVFDQNNCLKQKTVTISSSNGPVVSTPSVTPVTCFESADGSSSIQITQGQMPYVVRWADGSATLQKNGLSRGDHIVEVSDAGNCNVFHTITIPSPAALEIQTLNKLDPTCFGVSNGSIAVTVAGGNGGNHFAWSNGATVPSVNGLKAGNYVVEVVDSKLCKRSMEFTLTDPAPFVIDLGPDKEMCEGQAMRLGIENLLNMTYDWYIKESPIGTDQYITVNKPGLYSLKATNANGCEATDAIELILNADLLKTDFLMALKAYAGDSIALIDISWPLPTSIAWEFNPAATVVYSTQDLAVVTIKEPGLYTFGVTSHLGGCSGQRLQTIEILEKTKEQDGGRIGTFSLVQDVAVYPNPSEGYCSLSIDLREIHDVMIQVVSLSGNKMVFTELLSDAASYHRDYNFMNLPAGIYFVIVRAEKESRVVRLIKI